MPTSGPIRLRTVGDSRAKTCRGEGHGVLWRWKRIVERLCRVRLRGSAVVVVVVVD